MKLSLKVRPWGRVSTTLRVGPADYNDFPEQQEEKELERQAQIARVTGRPWAEAPEGFVVPRQWMDDIDRGRRSPLGSSSVPMFPPSRDDAQYGPRAGNPEGDEQFQSDRARWCEAHTGETFDGRPLSEQSVAAGARDLPPAPSVPTRGVGARAGQPMPTAVERHERMHVHVHVVQLYYWPPRLWICVVAGPIEVGIPSGF